MALAGLPSCLFESFAQADIYNVDVYSTYILHSYTSVAKRVVSLIPQ